MQEAEGATIAELRRRIQGSFSLSELRSLGAAIGLSHVEAWDRGSESTTRDIVRRAHEGPGLGVLLERLRLDRPLVEWPDPTPSQRAEAESGASIPGLALSPEAPDLDGPTIVDPYADPGADPGAAAPARPTDLTPPPVPVDPSSAAAVDAPPPSEVEPLSSLGAPPDPPDAPSNPWPMANLREPQRGGLDTRILAIAIACVSLVVVVAFVGGMAFSRRGAPAVASAGGRTDTLAGRAANAMDGAIVEVARGCGLVVQGPPDRLVLKRAQVSCGHPVAVAGRPPPGYDPADIEPPKLEVLPASPRTRPITGPTGPVGPPADLCRAGCKSERRSCMAACGSEPTDASGFDAFQQCHSKCLGAESTCSQRCP